MKEVEAQLDLMTQRWTQAERELSEIRAALSMLVRASGVTDEIWAEIYARSDS